MAKCKACAGTGRIAGKKYLHVAEKYLRQCPGLEWPREYLARAHYEACRVAEALNVPAAYWPRPEHGALRVLDYPPGAGTVEHTDFDTLTVNLWRFTPEDVLPRMQPYHLGEIAELVGIGPAFKHSVPARPYRQRSLVYFALPDHAAVLPDGRTVKEYLEERIARSRY